MGDDELRRLILDKAADAARNFVHYDREEDEDLSPDDLEDACLRGVVSVDDIAKAFRDELVSWGGLDARYVSESEARDG